MKLSPRRNSGTITLAVSFLTACIVIVGIGVVIATKLQKKVDDARKRIETNALEELSVQMLNDYIAKTGDTNARVITSYSLSSSPGTLQVSSNLIDWEDLPGSTPADVGFIIEEVLNSTNPPSMQFYRVKP